MNSNKWFIIKMPRPTAKIRLFCFPFAGGSVSAFNNWPASFQDTIEVVIIQYPGREDRIKEKPLEKIENFVDCISEAIKPLCDKHVAFFGHSMGSKIVYELSKKFQKEGKKIPFCAIISGGRAPNIVPRFTIYNLEREKFIKGLKKYKGTPDEILNDKNIIDFFLPMLQADFKADETYLDTECVSLECPLYVLGGEEDIITSREELAAWEKYAKNKYQEKIFLGGHFFIKNQFSSVALYIQNILLSEFNK